MRWLSLIAILALCACNLLAGEPITPTPSIPTVAFQYPTNNVSIAEGTDLQIQLLAQDEVGVSRIELRVDGQPHQDASPVDSDTVPVFTVDMNWLALGGGFHVLEATAFRLDGTQSRPALINVNVIPQDATPVPLPGS